ncbi:MULTISPECIES: PA3496 family putative envelope integrity protein [Chromohalobacter]|uniref:PA3496 family putative envelope integrity protein n=1 Tax=Chromohalobacter TaxID=42054 RepID=UPI001FFC6B6E|nr:MULTISPECIES: hypothetical protein [Chromohalobacter]MCK2045936.1 hypothetical protein [Chromohalobacter moromii]MCT8469119.1 hypothetical protein [Chromohalobacter canadensis]MCT8472691.1 hypothetical protein [Chromohalobacter canadensis]MCT8500144.1 hypothetical protein [Chromohalobacter canadensis]
MRDAAHLQSLKSELLDIHMSLEMLEHEQRKKNAATRYLRARRGIELHQEFKRLERDIVDYDDWQ